MESRHRPDHEYDVDRATSESEPARPHVWPGKHARTNVAMETDVQVSDLRRIRGMLEGLRSGGLPLPAPVSVEYSKLLGVDRSEGEAATVTNQLGASAFTHSTFGRHFLAHELAHVARNKRGNELDPADSIAALRVQALQHPLSTAAADGSTSRVWTEGLRGVANVVGHTVLQARADLDADPATLTRAARGIAGTGTTLPFFELLQAAFGKH